MSDDAKSTNTADLVAQAYVGGGAQGGSRGSVGAPTPGEEMPPDKEMTIDGSFALPLHFAPESPENLESVHFLGAVATLGLPAVNTHVRGKRAGIPTFKPAPAELTYNWRHLDAFGLRVGNCTDHDALYSGCDLRPSFIPRGRSVSPIEHEVFLKRDRFLRHLKKHYLVSRRSVLDHQPAGIVREHLLAVIPAQRDVGDLRSPIGPDRLQ